MPRKYQVGDRVFCNGYDGTVIRICEWSENLYEVRLPGGVACVSDADISTPLRSELTDAGEQTIIPGCERDDERTGAKQLSLF